MTLTATRPLPTAAEALAQHGLDWDRLERIARKALRDRMNARRIALSDERREAALEFCVDRGASRAREYDPDLAAGISLETFLYRRMYHGLDDYLRAEGGDSRRGRPLRVELTYNGQLPEPLAADTPADDDFDRVAEKLSAEASWTLQNLGKPISEGTSIVIAAHTARIPVAEAEQRLERLYVELREAA